MDPSDAVDKFASLIIPNCQISASQEAKLQSCPFAPQSEVLPENDDQSSEDASEQATVILMVSLSSEEYQTPPEHHRSHSENSSNDGHVSPAAVDQKMRSRDGDNDGETVVVVVDDDDNDFERLIDLTNETDNLLVSGKSDHNDTLNMDGNKNNDGNENDKINDDTERVNDIDTEDLVTENQETELVDLLKESAHEVFVEMPERTDEAASVVSGTKVDATLLNKGKRKLPFSLNVEEKKSHGYSKHETFMNSLNRVSTMLVGDARGKDGGEAEIDFYATVKMRGMTFPRPHWWPPEGSEKGLIS